VDQIRGAFFTGRCDVYTGDSHALRHARGQRAGAAKAEDFVILPEIISKEPLAPAFRHGDNQWGDIIRWTNTRWSRPRIRHQLQERRRDAEERTPRSSASSASRPHGKSLGLDEKWVYNIIKLVGNYGESFDRNLGKDSPIKIDRG